ncbi:CLUMA_CG005325, isoform A [Clunio marinus]|uniref:Cytochrome b-c1 complex subunit 8 n=1 Tax=Clunio marinus TaxID=568069 RepID=A0A1J1HWE0_9DIPT|nr:CLUMA_CG005325, isoform A [Clunio marinus]
MGGHFGELAKVNGIVIHKISPFEQKAFAGFISKGVPNTFRRFRSQVFRVAPPFIVGYLVYDYVENLHASYLRKNPADFENDE